MPKFRVTAEWEGSAAATIEAADENEAERVARSETWCGFNVEGGMIDFEVTSVEPLPDDAEVTS